MHKPLRNLWRRGRVSALFEELLPLAVAVASVLAVLAILVANVFGR